MPRLLPLLVLCLVLCSPLPSTSAAEPNSPNAINITACAPRIEKREPASERMRTLHAEQMLYLHSIVGAGVCEHFYLDLGTNIGVSIRKVYEPQYYPDAPLITRFDEIFGLNRSRVCSVGFEPNAVHVDWLQQIQKSYRRAGFPAVIFTSSALAAEAGALKFFRIAGYQEAGSSVMDLHGLNDDYVEAIAVDTNAFLQHLFHLWHLSASYTPGKSKVFAKMDIEGSEYFVLPHMFTGGSLCQIDEMSIEWHPSAVKCAPADAAAMAAMTWITSAACPNYRLTELDDETYSLKDPGPLPTHQSDYLKPLLPAAAYE
ncbi:hypothetical protein B484DRAFT_456819 [Ochromonadaceae sp. CCMP2298]|nr:hypothetical protein B484DRAFT_456819 [Ochromonadaceae sp. CCMP2298]